MKELQAIIKARDQMSFRIEKMLRMIEENNNNECCSIKHSSKPTQQNNNIVIKKKKKTLDNDSQCCAFLYKYQKGGAISQRCSREKNGTGDFCIMHKKTMKEKYANKELPKQGGEPYIFKNEETGDYYYGKKCLFTKKSGFRKQRPFKVEYVWQQFGAINREFVAIDQEGIEFYRGETAFFFTGSKTPASTPVIKEITNCNDTEIDTQKDNTTNVPELPTASSLIDSQSTDSDDDEILPPSHTSLLSTLSTTDSEEEITTNGEEIDSNSAVDNLLDTLS